MDISFPLLHRSSPIQVYWSSIFIIPCSIVRKIESTLALFLWKGTSLTHIGAKVARASLCYLLNKGGLGIKSLKIWNKAATLQLLKPPRRPLPLSLLPMMHPQLLLQKQSGKRKGEGSERRLGDSNLVVVFLPYLNKCLIQVAGTHGALIAFKNRKLSTIGHKRIILTSLVYWKQKIYDVYK